MKGLEVGLDLYIVLQDSEPLVEVIWFVGVMVLLLGGLNCYRLAEFFRRNGGMKFDKGRGLGDWARSGLTARPVMCGIVE